MALHSAPVAATPERSERNRETFPRPDPDSSRCVRDIPPEPEAAGQLRGTAQRNRVDRDQSTVAVLPPHPRETTRRVLDRSERKRQNRHSRVVDGGLITNDFFGPVMYVPQQQQALPPKVPSTNRVMGEAKRAETATAAFAHRHQYAAQAKKLLNPPDTAQLERDHGMIGAYCVNPPTTPATPVSAASEPAASVPARAPVFPAPTLPDQKVQLAQKHEITSTYPNLPLRSPRAPVPTAPPKTPMTRARPPLNSKWAAKKEALRTRLAGPVRRLASWIQGEMVRG